MSVYRIGTAPPVMIAVTHVIEKTAITAASATATTAKIVRHTVVSAMKLCA